jgi:hypothetical protein
VTGWEGYVEGEWGRIFQSGCEEGTGDGWEVDLRSATV